MGGARIVMGWILWLACFVSAQHAHAQVAVAPEVAQTAFTHGRVSLHADLGYGFAVQGDSLRNPYDFMVAASGGYTFDFGLYVGVTADYFIGDTEYVAGTRRDSLQWDYDWSHIAAEAGYDFALRKLVLRPSVQAGAAVRGSCLDDVCNSDTFLSIAPAITSLAPLGDHSFFTFGLRYLFIPGGDGDPIDGVSFSAGLGATF